VGEIWVASPSVTQGYWMRPADNALAFGARLPDDDRPFLRTGDLGFVRDGELFVTGRLKDLIIVRGRNLAPEDVERSVEASHPALRAGCGAAFAVEVGGAESLVVVQEIRPEQAGEAEAAIDAIRDAIAREHGLAPHAVVIVAARTVPKTSSGKLERHACRRAFLDRTLATLLPSPPGAGAPPPPAAPERETPDAGALETWLRTHVAAVLGLAPESVNVHKPIATYGVDSAEAAGLIAGLEDWLGRRLPLDLLWEWASTREIAARLAEHLAGGEPAAVDLEPRP
jgi:acyl carrier protein